MYHVPAVRIIVVSIFLSRKDESRQIGFQKYVADVQNLRHVDMRLVELHDPSEHVDHCIIRTAYPCQCTKNRLVNENRIAA